MNTGMYGRDIEYQSSGLTSAVIAIMTDLLVALLPVPLLWQLQLNLRTKISLMFVLSLGIFAAVAAIVKMKIQKTIFQDPDPFVHDRFTLWRFIELDVGIVAASLPALKPMFNWCLGAARSVTSRAPRGTDAPNSLAIKSNPDTRTKRLLLLNSLGDRPILSEYHREGHRMEI